MIVPDTAWKWVFLVVWVLSLSTFMSAGRPKHYKQILLIIGISLLVALVSVPILKFIEWVLIGCSYRFFGGPGAIDT